MIRLWREVEEHADALLDHAREHRVGDTEGRGDVDVHNVKHLVLRDVDQVGGHVVRLADIVDWRGDVSAVHLLREKYPILTQYTDILLLQRRRKPLIRPLIGLRKVNRMERGLHARVLLLCRGPLAPFR